MKWRWNLPLSVRPLPPTIYFYICIRLLLRQRLLQDGVVKIYYIGFIFIILTMQYDDRIYGRVS